MEHFAAAEPMPEHWTWEHSQPDFETMAAGPALQDPHSLIRNNLIEVHPEPLQQRDHNVLMRQVFHLPAAAVAAVAKDDQAAQPGQSKAGPVKSWST